MHQHKKKKKKFDGIIVKSFLTRSGSSLQVRKETDVERAFFAWATTIQTASGFFCSVRRGIIVY
jgi:hypothetical protein